jgi:hypothetical protein
MARSLVKVRVTGLDSIPWFFNFLEGKDPESNSWTMQCEIILIRMLGALPQDEDFPPDDPNDVDPNQFELFGFGQQGQGLANPPEAPNQFNAFNADATNPAWAPWPNQNVAQCNTPGC